MKYNYFLFFFFLICFITFSKGESGCNLITPSLDLPINALHVFFIASRFGFFLAKMFFETKMNYILSVGYNNN